ncbi:hypothetical protein D3C86_1446350 [compost metagenome]
MVADGDEERRILGVGLANSLDVARALVDAAGEAHPGPGGFEVAAQMLGHQPVVAGELALERIALLAAPFGVEDDELVAQGEGGDRFQAHLELAGGRERKGLRTIAGQ